MLDKRILEELKNYVSKHITVTEFSLREAEAVFSPDIMKEEDLENYISAKRSASFAEVLFRFIDYKGYTDSDVYKKAGIDRRHFSKIRTNPAYRISKSSAVSLSIALKLNKKETEKLLHSAGFSLSNNDTFDLIIQFCLEQEIYDIDYVNQALDQFDLKPLISL